MLKQNIFSLLLLQVVLLLLQVVAASAADIDIEWKMGMEIQSMSGESLVGKTIRFVWRGYHNVAVHFDDPSKCNVENVADSTLRMLHEGEEGLAGLGDVTEYEMTIEEGIWNFVCTVPGHCEAGQKLQISAYPGAPDENLPEDKSCSVAAECGRWDTPDGNGQHFCDYANGDSGTCSPCLWGGSCKSAAGEWNVDDGSEVYRSCQCSCQRYQEFCKFATEAPTSAPTYAPIPEGTCEDYSERVPIIPWLDCESAVAYLEDRDWMRGPDGSACSYELSAYIFAQEGDTLDKICCKSCAAKRDECTSPSYRGCVPILLGDCGASFQDQMNGVTPPTDQACSTACQTALYGECCGEMMSQIDPMNNPMHGIVTTLKTIDCGGADNDAGATGDAHKCPDGSDAVCCDMDGSCTDGDDDWCCGDDFYCSTDGLEYAQSMGGILCPWATGGETPAGGACPLGAEIDMCVCECATLAILNAGGDTAAACPSLNECSLEGCPTEFATGIQLWLAGGCVSEDEDEEDDDEGSGDPACWMAYNSYIDGHCNGTTSTTKEMFNSTLFCGKCIETGEEVETSCPSELAMVLAACDGVDLGTDKNDKDIYQGLTNDFAKCYMSQGCAWAYTRIPEFCFTETEEPGPDAPALCMEGSPIDSPDTDGASCYDLLNWSVGNCTGAEGDELRTFAEMGGEGYDDAPGMQANGLKTGMCPSIIASMSTEAPTDAPATEAPTEAAVDSPAPAPTDAAPPADSGASARVFSCALLALAALAALAEL